MTTFLTLTLDNQFEGPDIVADSWKEAERKAAALCVRVYGRDAGAVKAETETVGCVMRGFRLAEPGMVA